MHVCGRPGRNPGCCFWCSNQGMVECLHTSPHFPLKRKSSQSKQVHSHANWEALALADSLLFTAPWFFLGDGIVLGLRSLLSVYNWSETLFSTLDYPGVRVPNPAMSRPRLAHSQEARPAREHNKLATLPSELQAIAVGTAPKSSRNGKEDTAPMFLSLCPSN